MPLLLADFIYSRDCKLNLRKNVDTTDCKLNLRKNVDTTSGRKFRQYAAGKYRKNSLFARYERIGRKLQEKSSSLTR